MTGKKKIIPEMREAEVVNEAMAARSEKMEFRLINPTEDGFLREIKWNKEELAAAVRNKIAAYENVVYTEDNIKQAKIDRAELNKLMKAIEERRKMVKKIINEPYDIFEAELKEILALIQEPVGIIDEQVKAFEDQQRDEKKKNIQKFYYEVVGDLMEVLPFEKVFDNRYLNQTYKLTTVQAEVRAKVERVRLDLETIDSLESKYKLNTKDVYIKTLDLSRALAENKRLSELEEKLETEKKRKAEEDAEKKGLAAEQRRIAEERAKAEEEQRKAEKEVATKELFPCTTDKSSNLVSEGQGTFIQFSESVSEPEIETENVLQSVEQQEYTMAVNPFVPKQEEVKRYRTKFFVVGSKKQLEKLIQFMNENNIEYGKIK